MKSTNSDPYFDVTLTLFRLFHQTSLLSPLSSLSNINRHAPTKKCCIELLLAVRETG